MADIVREDVDYGLSTAISDSGAVSTNNLNPCHSEGRGYRRGICFFVNSGIADSLRDNAALQNDKCFDFNCTLQMT
jgi:hypothetical protein